MCRECVGNFVCTCLMTNDCGTAGYNFIYRDQTGKRRDENPDGPGKVLDKSLNILMKVLIRVFLLKLHIKMF